MCLQPFGEIPLLICCRSSGWKTRLMSIGYSVDDRERNRFSALNRARPGRATSDAPTVAAWPHDANRTPREGRDTEAQFTSMVPALALSRDYCGSA
jgi:hypothetical protein